MRNNFPWPTQPNEEARQAVEAAAQAVPDACAKKFNHDTERVQHLFERYAELSAPCPRSPTAKPRPAASGPA